ncbi:hypothetical protein PSTG_03233 [Puccinia striiformis f. sp. tritici PST-78]|uniref:Uncharacterized protein n=1 Tax=Puccinia striiformis f. sp. tritici PST-78 TaxID=1165861 RepID=A0A0L0VXF7_9BASI|nr:hypothetical protein PSTG_03233 [Puccinia striiformis f. sp. tritici PST-78]
MVSIQYNTVPIFVTDTSRADSLRIERTILGLWARFRCAIISSRLVLTRGTSKQIRKCVSTADVGWGGVKFDPTLVGDTHATTRRSSSSIQTNKSDHPRIAVSEQFSDTPASDSAVRAGDSASQLLGQARPTYRRTAMAENCSDTPVRGLIGPARPSS